MAYTIQAIIGDHGTTKFSDIDEKYLVNLRHAVSMIPLVHEYRTAHGIPFLPLIYEGLDAVPESIAALCSHLSLAGPVAYIEADFFGGQGMQASAMWQHGAMLAKPIHSLNAINEALGFLGLEKPDGMDLFDSVGLGDHRDTEKWLKKRQEP